MGAIAMSASTIDSSDPFGRVSPQSEPQSAARHSWFVVKVIDRANQRQQEQASV